MTTVITSGRTDLADLFKLSGCLDGPRSHHPFLAFVVDGDTVRVERVVSAEDLVSRYPAETPVMVQWPGHWRSDFFQMTVRDVASALDAHRQANQCRNCGTSLIGKGWQSAYAIDPEKEYRFCHPCARIIDERVKAGATPETITFERDSVRA